MVHVSHIDAPERSPDCSWIRFLFLSRGQKITTDEAYRWLIVGAVVRVGSEEGPKLQPASRPGRRYVRCREADTPEDPLLFLPRKV